MSVKIDVSQVSIKSFPANGDINPVNAGIWHNYFLYTGRNAEQQTGWSDDYKVWSDLLVVKAQENEDKKILPTGSVAYVKRIADILKNGGSGKEGDFKPVISQLQEVFDTLKKDGAYNTTPLVGVASIAYYSSLFWSEVNLTEDPALEANFFKIKIPKWLKTVAKDILGALTGGAAGIEVGGFIGGPVGAAVGCGVGVVAGGIAGSTLLDGASGETV